MVAQHYRWDFVGLSTDTKPTPETSEKVVDGSTFYCSDTSKLYVFCKDTWYERKALGGGGGGTTYTAGDGIDITNDTISVDTDTIQEKLTAGTGIDITNNTISATGGGGGPTVVQATGTSTTDVMSQDATTKLVYKDGSTLSRIQIGQSADSGANYSIAIGSSAVTSKPLGVAVGYYSYAGNSDSVALGSYAQTTKDAQINIGVTNSNHGYNNTYYRLLSGVYDGQDAHDAVTVNQINALIDAINSATNSSIPHIGS